MITANFDPSRHASIRGNTICSISYLTYQHMMKRLKLSGTNWKNYPSPRGCVITCRRKWLIWARWADMLPPRTDLVLLGYWHLMKDTQVTVQFLCIPWVVEMVYWCTNLWWPNHQATAVCFPRSASISPKVNEHLEVTQQVHKYCDVIWIYSWCWWTWRQFRASQNGVHSSLSMARAYILNKYIHLLLI